jgi:hypothetical protein
MVMVVLFDLASASPRLGEIRLRAPRRCRNNYWLVGISLKAKK